MKKVKTPLTKLEYRQIHKKCKYCENLVHKSALELPMNITPGNTFMCDIKDKAIKFPNLPVFFCPCYKVKE